MNHELLIKKVIENYDIGKLLKYSIIEGGCVNTNFKIETNKGLFFFREYNKHFCNQSKINHLAKVLSELKKEGFPVAQMIYNKDKKPTSNYENKVFAIFEFVEGQIYDFSEKSLISAAKTLARLHKKTSKISSKHTTIVKIKHFIAAIPNNLWEGNDSILKKYEQNQSNNKEVIQLIKRTKHHFDLFLQNNKYVQEKENISIVHGDFHIHQLIFQEQEVAALIDFDDVKYGLAEYDLIKGVVSFIGFPNKTGFNFNNLKIFLDAYRKIYGKIDLQPEEVLAYLRISLLAKIEYFISNYIYKHKKNEGISIVKGLLEKLDWIEKNDRKIKKRFLD
jgi:homoserine kinase type II